MESIGKYLKAQRESLDLTIEAVAQSTRIKSYHIKQIEDDDFDAIGDVGYIKAIIITYCRAIDSNEEIVKNKLEKLFNKPIEPPIKINTAKNVKPVIFSLNVIYFFFLGILAILLTIALLTIYRKGTFSINDIKNQFAAIEKKAPKPIVLDDLQPDSLWSYQRNIFNITNNIDNETGISATSATINTKIDSTIKNNIKPRNTANHFVRDKTDYIGELIFNNVESPLNPQ